MGNKLSQLNEVVKRGREGGGKQSERMMKTAENKQRERERGRMTISVLPQIASYFSLALISQCRKYIPPIQVKK